MAALKTNYVDDVLNTSVNEKRKYNMVQNADGTVSFDDVTTYTQNGDLFGAKDINDTNTAVNALNENLTAEDNLQFKFGKDGDGNYGYYGADGSLIPFRSGLGTATILKTGSGNLNYTIEKDYKAIIMDMNWLSGNSPGGDAKAYIDNSAIQMEYYTSKAHGDGWYARSGVGCYFDCKAGQVITNDAAFEMYAILLGIE